MIPLQITPDIDKAPWADLVHLKKIGSITRVGRLTRGCVSGKSTVSVLVEMPDGKQFMAQTTMALFLAAARAFKAVEDEASGGNSQN